MRPSARSRFLRDSAVSTVLVLALYVLAQHVLVRALQIPGYLLVVGFDALETVFGSAGRAYPVLFGAYLVGLGLIGGALAHAARRSVSVADAPPWRVGLAGGLAVVGLLGVGFALLLLATTSQRDAVYLVGATAGVMLAASAVLADAFGVVERLDGR